MKLPKTIYVKWEELENDDPYLHANVSLFHLAEDDEVTIGIYLLSETKRIKKTVIIKSPK